MLGGTDEPASFRRSTKSQFVGCIGYALMIPTFAIVGSIVGGMAGVGLGTLARNETLAMILAGTGAATGFFGCGYWGIRDYRRRSGTQIDVHADRLEWATGSSPVKFKFEDLDWLEGPGAALRIRRKNGDLIDLGAEEWPIQQIAKALVEKAVPGMTHKFNERLDAGETLHFRPANLLAIRLMLLGAICFVAGGALLTRWLTGAHKAEGPTSFGVPVFLLGTGISLLFQSRRVGGGILVDKTGVRRRKQDPLIPWRKLRQLSLSREGALLEADDGTTIRIGALTRNYDACLAVLKSWMVTTE